MIFGFPNKVANLLERGRESIVHESSSLDNCSPGSIGGAVMLGGHGTIDTHTQHACALTWLNRWCYHVRGPHVTIDTHMQRAKKVRAHTDTQRERERLAAFLSKQVEKINGTSFGSKMIL